MVESPHFSDAPEDSSAAETLASLHETRALLYSKLSVFSESEYNKAIEAATKGEEKKQQQQQ